MALRELPTQGARAGSNFLILAFFFLTGITGLAYELVWIRLLILAFGSTQFAVTTVLVTFMAGLALGSLVFGRLIDRFRSPLTVYAAIEAALGVYCVLSPSIFNMVRDFYVSIPVAPGAASAPSAAGFELNQFLLSFGALIVPTTLMGGTLPALVKYLVKSSGRIGFHTAVPYAVNTLGAVTGCLATGFFALYVIGVKTTIYAAGAIDIAVGALVFAIYGSSKSAPSERSPGPPSKIIEFPSSKRTLLNTVVISAFAVSGFASLSYEVLWTRVFSLVLGSSIYAFTVMLATFLAGIGIGSILFAPFIDRRKNPVAWFAVLEAVIGVVALLSIFIYKELPLVFYNVKESLAGRFWLFVAVQFLLSSAVMILPTLSMGAIFPLVGRIYSRSPDTVGKSIGDVYFFNTAGSIAGAFVAGFILLPVIGVQKGVVMMAALNLVLAAVLYGFSESGPKAKAAVPAVLGAFFLSAVYMLPAWDRTLMTMGLYVNPVERQKFELIKKGAFEERLLYYREGINAVITVRAEGSRAEVISYQANGKQEARSVGGRPAEAWAILGHLPVLMHPGDPERALVVGLGSGITLGAMEHYPLKEFDVVEIEKAVVDAAGFFSLSNNNALEDKRVRLHLTDGRSFLFTAKNRYDVIVSAVSDPWITGVSNLFTREYFEEVSNKLNDDGVVALWFQNYRITPAELKVGLNTFASVFPYVSVWFHYTDTLDLVVIGSKKPHAFDMARLAGKFDDPEVRKGLSRIGINGPYDVLDLFLMGNDDLRRYMGATILNTDEKPYLEFRLPKLQYLDPTRAVELVEEMLRNAGDAVPPVVVPEKDMEAFYVSLGKSYNKFSFRLGQSLKAFEKALEINPRNKEASIYAERLRGELGSPGAPGP